MDVGCNMELKQLEFFLECVECGSLSKAAAKLYTSQPNVSKVIRALENELGNILFERTSRGLKLTAYGKSIYEYALNSVKNANLIASTKQARKRNTFYVSTCQSNSISQLLVNLYKNNHDLIIEHHQGTVEEILTQVEHGISEMGILYVSQKHIAPFLNIVARKKLEFVTLGKRKACVYAGPNSPLYKCDFISFDELPNLRYVRGLSDFFSVEDGLEHVSLGLMNSENIQPMVYTNSEHFAINLLLHTDLVDIGINLDHANNAMYDLKNLSIEGEDSYLTLGYITEEGHTLTKYANELIKYIQDLIEP